MRQPIRLPDLGLPGKISFWFAQPGDSIYEGDRLIEILCGEATFDLSAPCDGILIEKCRFPQDGVSSGDLLGWIESSDHPQEVD